MLSNIERMNMRSSNKNRITAAGFSLIEMMIAIAVGMMIVAALTSVIFGTTSTTRTNERTSELQSNGRYALDIVKRDVQHAGYHDQTDLTSLSTNPVVINNDCLVNFTRNFTQSIWGSDNANPFAATCIPAANYVPGTDVFVIRYASTESVLVPAAPAAKVAPVFNISAPNFTPPGTANTLYYRTAYAMSDLTQGNAIPTVTADPARDHLVQVHVYYVAPWTTAPNEVPAVPSLRRMVLDNNTGTLIDELVTSGIENMQVQYGSLESDANGIPTTFANGMPTGNVHFDDANAVDVAAVNAATPWSKWNAVSSIRIWLLSRNSTTDRGDGYVNNTVYVMGNQNVQAAAADNMFRRQLYTTTVELRN